MNEPMIEYLADKIECGYSDLHAILRSGLHCWWQNRQLNPEYKPSYSATLDGGSLSHKLLLGKGADIVEIDAPDWRTKAAKEARQAAYDDRKLPVLKGKMADALAMADAARKYLADSEIAGVLDEGDPEKTLRWKEGETLCRGTPDHVNRAMKICLDYKSTGGSAHPDSFLRFILNAGYDLQAVHYLRALPTGFRFVWLVQENEPPYACSLVAMDPAMMETAARKWDYALTLWKTAVTTNQWRGYSSRITYLAPPAWEMSRVEEMLELGEQG